jgi:hypothetical protein
MLQHKKYAAQKEGKQKGRAIEKLLEASAIMIYVSK